MMYFLVGMMGCGKSTMGKYVSTKMNIDFIEMDEVIVKTKKMSIEDIFKIKGESKFREYESEVLEQIIDKYKDNTSKVIISTGGGIILSNNNVMLMRKYGHVIFLDVDAKELFNRIKDSDRPLIKENPTFENFNKLIIKRQHLYIDAANIILTNINKKNTINELISIIKS